MAYTGTYEQELRKNPTDYKLRAMGKRKYQLLQKEKGGKVSVSRIGEANMPGDFGVGKEREIERSNVRSLLRQNLKKEMEKIEKGEPLGEKKKDSKSQDSKKSINTKGEPKTRKEFGVGEKRVIDESGRKSTTESKSDDKTEQKKGFSGAEKFVTGAAGVLFVTLAGNIIRKSLKGRRARRSAELQSKKNLNNLKQNNPSKFAKVTEQLKKMAKTLDPRTQKKPEVKSKEENKKNTGKKKNLFQRLKNRVLQKVKQKTTSSTGGRTGAPAGMGTGGTPFGGKDFDGRKKKTVY